MEKIEILELLKSFMGDSRKSGKELLFFCPKCNHPKKKLSVNVEKSVFKCWTCEPGFSGPLIRLFRLYADKSLYKRFAEEFSTKSVEGFRDKFLSNFSSEEIERKNETLKLPKQYRPLCLSYLEKESKRAYNYLINDRGLNQDQINYWKIGFCKTGNYRGRIIVPSFDAYGRCNYFAARTYIGNYRKYDNPPVSKNIIFNEINIDFTREVTIVEGVFDAIKAGDNAVPILGKTLKENSALFEKIVRMDTPVCVALDPEAEKNALNLVHFFQENDIEARFLPMEDKERDIGDMSSEEYESIRKNAFQPSFVDYLTTRLESL